jgi:glycosyltransferase involved in cell wall biosynthesis
MVKDNSKLTAVILTFNCGRYIEKTISKLQLKYFDKIIFTDDGSTDNTINIIKKNNFSYIQNNHSGYGGNLLAGLKKAFDEGATYVIEIHGDGQYLDNNIEELMNFIICNNSDLVLGDRFKNKKATLQNKMPLHIYYGNIFLSFIAKFGLGFHLNDFFPGYRVYSKNFFHKILDYKLSTGYQFSFEVIAIAKLLNLKIDSIPVVCNYKDEKQTAPLWYIFPCLYNLIIRCLQFRMAKIGINLSVFKKINTLTK